MFIPCSEKKGSAYYEFQYCKKTWPLPKLTSPGGYGYWEKDSILVHIDNDEEFFENYRQYLEPTNAPDGTAGFCYYGVNYYTKEQAKALLKRISEDKPKEYEVVVAWLEKAVTDYNGFFFLGI